MEAIWEERNIDRICATLQSHSPGLDYSGQGYIKAARAGTEGEELPLSSVADHPFTCTTCGNCERICPIGMQPMAINRALRSKLITRDLAPNCVVEIQENVLTQQNPAGEVLADRCNGSEHSEEKRDRIYRYCLSARLCIELFKTPRGTGNTTLISGFGAIHSTAG